MNIANRLGPLSGAALGFFPTRTILARWQQATTIVRGNQLRERGNSETTL